MKILRDSFLTLMKEQQTFSIKSQIVDISDSVGHTVTTTLLSYGIVTAKDDT